MRSTIVGCGLLVLMAAPSAAMAQELTNSAPGDTSVTVTLTANQTESISIKFRGRNSNNILGSQTGSTASVSFPAFTHAGGITSPVDGFVDARHPDGSITLIAQFEVEALFTGGYTTSRLITVNETGTPVGTSSGHFACAAAVDNWGDGGSFIPNGDLTTGGTCFTVTSAGTWQTAPMDLALHIPPSATNTQSRTFLITADGTL